MNLISRIAGCAFAAALMSFAGLSAVAQEPDQLLQTIEAYGKRSVLDMKFDVPAPRPTDFTTVFTDPAANSDYVSCIRVPGGGLNCLDQNNRLLKRFNSSANTVETVLDCLALPGLGGRRGGDCIAFSFGLFDGTGIRAIAGNEKGKAYDLFGLFNKGSDPCPAGTTAVAGSNPAQCVRKLYMGRPLLQDLKPFTGDLAANFPNGSGFVGIEQRGELMFFPVPVAAQPTVLADKKAFDLKGNVGVLGGDLLQIETSPGVFAHYGVITTDTGMLLAKNLSGAGSVISFDIKSTRSGAACSSGDPGFGVRVSTQDDSSFVIVTDRNFCQTFALVPAKNASGLTGFSIVQETGGGNQILSTGATPPVGATDSPGDFFNLIGAGCEEPGGCVVVNGAGGVAAATLFDVNVVNRNQADVVIYHVRGLTDCGLKPLTCVTLLDEDPDFDLAAACPGLPASPTRAEAIACLTDPDVNALRRVAGASPGSTRPEVFERNYTPFLPDDVTDNFDTSGTPPSGIPPLWFRPDLRGRLINQGNLGLLFFVTEAREEDVLTIDFEVSQLQGGSIIRDCESFANGGLPPGYTVDAEPGGAARGTERLLDGDIPHRTSERYDSFVAGEHIGTNILAGCGSTRGRAVGVSGFLYDAEYTPCPGTLDAGGNLVFDAQGSCAVGEPLAPGATWLSLQAAESEDDAVFAKAYVRYLIELRQQLEIKLCTPSTPSADDAVLSQADCSTLRNNWINLQDKSSKAILAVIQPKQSGGAQNFGAVNSQLSNYQSNLLAADRSGPNRPADLSNEYGQQIARVETLIFLLENRLEPSVPANGFNESDVKWADIEFSLP